MGVEHITGFIRREHRECRLSGRTVPEHDFGVLEKENSVGIGSNVMKMQKKKAETRLGGYFCLLGKPNRGSKKSA